MRMRAVSLASALALGFTGTLAAQAVQGRATFVSSYVWRGLTLVNRPVLQPELSTTRGPISIGLWANLEPIAYTGDRDISVLGGRGAPGFTEFDPYVELGSKVRGTEVALGAYGYLYTHAAGYETDPNTLEIYGRASLPGPVPLELSAWYDVHAVRGVYLEAAVERPAPGLAPLQLALRVGASVG